MSFEREGEREREREASGEVTRCSEDTGCLVQASAFRESIRSLHGHLSGHIHYSGPVRTEDSRWWCSLFLLGIRLVAYGHLASLSLLSATSSTTHSPIINIIRLLSIQRSPCDLWSCRCLKVLPARGATQDARSEERAADREMHERAGHFHTPKER